MFRTILNDCRKLILPVINEIFDEGYTGDEKVEFFPNEHFLDQQNMADKECFFEYDDDERKLAELKMEYKDILERLDELERQEVIGAFDKRTIIELSDDVVKEIAKKHENVQKGIGEVMGGALIETSARKLKNEGISEGIKVGIRKLVESLRSLSIPDETIEAQLVERYQMSKDEAIDWVRKTGTTSR